MKPRNKTEREVVRLSKTLTRLTPHQMDWVEKNLIDPNQTVRFHRKKANVEHFIVCTTKDGWQVLRHFYLYAYYRYNKVNRNSIWVGEVMQQWYKDGKYVFMARNRHMGYCADGWIFGQPMSIKKDYSSTYILGDPRNLGYRKVKYERLLSPFKYIEKDDKCENRIEDMFRAFNAHPFNETLYKQNKKVWQWSIDNHFIFDREKTSAIKIAVRHGYDFMKPEWRDLVEMLLYLKKDVHNPIYVCPANLKSMHDKISKLAQSKREKQERRMEELAQIRRERQELEHLRWQEEYERRQAEREEERKKEAKGMMSFYQKMRQRFFGIVIAENELEIKVLQSVEEFMEEGKEMHHCVFANGYYDVRQKPYCLILSAKVNGKRMETIEVNLKDYTIVQSRGKHNQSTEYHERILNLLNGNMKKIMKVNKLHNP